MCASKPFTLNYITYGSKINAETIRQLLEHSLTNIGPGKRLPTPICIWGKHGIGKTELVREWAQEKGFAFVYIAPAQFEEMGDLVGMPTLQQNPEGQSVTRFAPPAWVPRQEGPGILLLDDVNRADDRILRGIMQLLQYYELVSWSLPAQWLIVLTANPDGGDYSVTTLDEAMLNRMLHVTMEFDAGAWARWAERNGVDERGRNFVLAYPELVNGRRTTPRSLVQFFQSIEQFEDFRENLPLIKLLADAFLDDSTTQAFVQFIHQKLDRLPGPADFLGSDNFEGAVQRLERLLFDGETKRLDMLSVVVSRMINYLLENPQPLGNEQFERLARFIQLDLLPNDLRLYMAQTLTGSKKPELAKLYSIPAIGKLLLEKM